MSIRLILTGGIGSGKTAASLCFADFGASVLHADEFAREVLAPGTEATLAVITRWPEVADGGVIDRGKLGRIVFADPVQLAALEEITLPPTRNAIMAAVADRADNDIVLEIPLLRDWFADWVIAVVDAPDDLRLSRAADRPGSMERSDVLAVMDRQPSRSEWLLAADLVIHNDGDLENLREECLAVWARVGGG